MHQIKCAGTWAHFLPRINKLLCKDLVLFCIEIFTAVRFEVFAVNFCKNCREMRCKTNNFRLVILTSFCGNFGESRWLIYFHSALSILTKTILPYTGSNLCPPAFLLLLIPLRQLSIASKFSCEFKSDWENVGQQMRQIFVRNAVKWLSSPQWPHFFQKFAAFLTKSYPKTSTRELINNSSAFCIWYQFSTFLT